MDLSLLPAINAVLNSIAATILVLALIAIKQGKEARHKALMLSATSVSALFLVSYLTYHYNHGSTRFAGEGAIRTVYFSILISHTILAATLLPLIVTTLTLALKGHRERHRRVARITWPVWMYVSVTGVIIYLMLYQL